MRHLLLLIILFWSTNLFSQVKDLNEKIFNKELLNTSWTNENDSSTIIVFSIKEDSVGLTYMNWAEGFISTKWTYKTSFKENRFILTAKNSEYKTKTAYIYGYLKVDGDLIISLQEKIVEDIRALLDNESECLILHKIKD